MLRTLERLPALVIALQRQQRAFAASVLDIAILHGFGNIALPCNSFDISFWNKAGAELADWPKQFPLQNISDRVACIASGPILCRAIECPPWPPIRIFSSEMPRHFVAADPFGLPDSIRGERQALSMLYSSSEEAKMLRIQLPAERPLVRIVRLYLSLAFCLVYLPQQFV